MFLLSKRNFIPFLLLPSFYPPLNILLFVPLNLFPAPAPAHAHTRARRLVPSSLPSPSVTTPASLSARLALSFAFPCKHCSGTLHSLVPPLPPPPTCPLCSCTAQTVCWWVVTVVTLPKPSLEQLVGRCRTCPSPPPLPPPAPFAPSPSRGSPVLCSPPPLAPRPLLSPLWRKHGPLGAVLSGVVLLPPPPSPLSPPPSSHPTGPS